MWGINQVTRNITHHIGFVVELGVVFEDLLLLGVFEGTSEVISAELLAPRLTVREPTMQIRLAKASAQRQKQENQDFLAVM